MKISFVIAALVTLSMPFVPRNLLAKILTISARRGWVDG